MFIFEVLNAFVVLLYPPETELIRRAQRTMRVLLFIDVMLLAGVFVSYLLGPQWLALSAFAGGFLFWTLGVIGFTAEHFEKKIRKEGENDDDAGE